MIEEIDKTYEQIENKILNHEIYQNVKDYSKAKEKMKTYLEVGELLKDADIKYGNNVIKDYSNRLTIKFGKQYTTSLLYKIKQFYNIIEKVPTLSGKLTWSHWYEMLPINDINKIIYYVNQCEINNIDACGLVRKMDLKDMLFKIENGVIIDIVPVDFERLKFNENLNWDLVFKICEEWNINLPVQYLSKGNSK